MPTSGPLPSSADQTRQPDRDAPPAAETPLPEPPFHTTSAWLAAVVASSDDAIFSKTLDGIILSWNAGAERIFGYTASETVGHPITMLIPESRLREDAVILARIRAGEVVDHYETIRRCKDGTLIDISLTVSPVRDRAGRIVGASKVARDISDRKRAEARRDLLLHEMNHRVKNLFALVNGLIALSARSADDVDDFAAVLSQRVMALARAHELTMPDLSQAMPAPSETSLHTLLAAIVAPLDNTEGSRLAISGPDIVLPGTMLTSLALLLHEFTTNAAKYGALSCPDGRLSVAIARTGDMMELTWTEIGGPRVTLPTSENGFGSRLERATVQGALQGQVHREWLPAGLVITLCIPLTRLMP
ncbi:PAS domain S-box protein [Gluconacetobacter azotocaptans]|uniref:PAS domain S-box protein n=1 Tax=Gluconacetobacter azotocaptans TaxID=142834 RepID=UPI00195CF4F4|nr:PAS domain S-box protein [Gluconacetobacter azotocaptans]MBM9401658.1 PAS domain S-box protein [Gluconacetobacter azotocaptans]